MTELKTGKMEALAAQVVTLVTASGLPWDEAIVALGFAGKALATTAAIYGAGSPEVTCWAAGRSFHEGLAMPVVITAGSVGGEAGSCTLH